MNNLNSSQPLQFDIFRDFELREIIEKTKSTQSSQLSQFNTNIDTNNISKQLEPNEIEEMNNMVRTLPFINDNIRTNIKLGIEIYKQLNNFDRNYIHSIINEKSTKSN